MKFSSKLFILPFQLIVFILGVFMAQNAYSQWTHFKPEGIKIPMHASGQLTKAAQVFQEEIQKRSQINLQIQAEKFLYLDGKPTLVIINEADLKMLHATEIAQLSTLAKTQKEGYKIAQINQNIIILGHDDRGCLYGVGKLLREMKDVAHRTKSAWLGVCWVNYRNLYLTQVNGKEWSVKNLRAITPTDIKFS